MSTPSPVAEEHLERLYLYGYTVIEGAMAPADVADARRQIEHLYRTDPGVAAKRDTATDTLHLENLPAKGKIFETFFLSPRVLPIAYHLLGDNFIAQDVWSFGIPPGAPGYRLHADDDVRAPDATLSMVTIYALVDFTRDNGATRVIPGSHRIPSYPAKPTYPGEVSVEAPAGSCVVFTGSLWHSSGANHTDAVRTSAAAYFTVPWIKQYIDLSRSLPPEVLDRATPEARRIFGLPSRPPHTERWQWDRTTGRPHEAHRATLTSRGYGTCCL